MPTLECPVEGCDWKSQDLSAEFAAALTAALRFHDRTAHQAQNPQPVHAQKLKLDSPTISAGCDADQWSEFCRQCRVRPGTCLYKVGMAITANMIPTAFFYCCDTDLKTDLIRDLQRDVATMPEADLLSVIKRLAVIDECTLVHCIKLNRMVQQAPGTGIRTFLANLRGQGSLCQYQAKWSGTRY